MKQVNTPIFNKKIKNAIRQIQRNRIKPPKDGKCIALRDIYTKKGKWEISYITSAILSYKKPSIVVSFVSKNKRRVSKRVREFQLKNV